MAECDRAIIGGGQLLQDDRLVFPLAIHSVVTEAQKQLVPIDFFSVGVGERWSKLGAYLVRRSLLADNVGAVMCRDELSAARLRELCPDASAKIDVTYDAALGLDNLSRDSASAKTIGLCVMHPNAIRIAGVKQVSAEPDAMIEFWTQVAWQLIQRGHEVRIFTNGAPVDQQFAATVRQAIQSLDPGTTRAILMPRPDTPDELVELISRFGVVVAHRLHANVISTLLSVPNVALEWDAKVEAFMSYTSQQDRFVRSGSTPAQVVDLIQRAIDGAGLDEAIRQKFLRTLQDDLAKVLQLNSSPKADLTHDTDARKVQYK